MWILTLIALTLSLDPRSVPSPCSNRWRTLCSLEGVESQIAEIETSVTNNGVETTITNIEAGQFDDGEFFPWLMEGTDTLHYGLSKTIQMWGPVNTDLLGDAQTTIKAALDAGNSYSTFNLGGSSSQYPTLAYSKMLSNGYYVSSLTQAHSSEKIVCSGETNAACNSWMAANILAKVRADLGILGVISTQSKLNNGDYDDGLWTPSLMDGSGNSWGSNTNTTAWFGTPSGYQELSHTENDVLYGGWVVPMTAGGATFYATLTYVNVDELVLPVSDWASLTLDAECSPETYKESCTHDYVSVVLGTVQTDSLTNSASSLATKFNNGDYVMGNGEWGPQLRSMADGSLLGSSEGSAIEPIPTDDELFFVAKNVPPTGGWVEFNSDEGPYKTYVLPILDDHYVTVGYINSATRAPTAAPSASTTTTSEAETTEPNGSGALNVAILGSLLIAFLL